MIDNDIEVMRREIVELAGFGIVSFTESGIIRFIDQAALVVFGLEKRFTDPAELVGRRLRDVVRGVGGPEWALAGSTRSGRRKSEYAIFVGNGERRWVSQHARLRDEAGSEEIIIDALVSDVTRRRLADEALIDSEARLKILFESAPDAIYLIDLAGTLVDGNRAAEKMIGFSRGEMIGKSFLRAGLLPLEEVPRVLLIWARCIAGDPTGPDEIVLMHRDGKRIAFEIRTFPVRIAGRHLVLGIGRDVTERRQVAETLRQANEELERRVAERTLALEQANASLRDEMLEREAAAAERSRLEGRLGQVEKMEALARLAGGLAHDLGNVLSAVSMLLAVAEEQLIHGQQIGGELDRAQALCDSGRALTQGLLDLARPQPETREPFDFEAKVRDIAEVVRRTVDRGIEVELGLDAGASVVIGDSGRIGHAILNICLNAVDAMGSRGHLGITTRRRLLTEEDLTELPPGLAPGAHVELVVSDSGPGMDAPTAEHAFEPFFTTKPAGQGTGLGLTIVYATVKSHGGVVTLDSRRGQGTAVTMILPLSVAPDLRPGRDPSLSG